METSFDNQDTDNDINPIEQIDNKETIQPFGTKRKRNEYNNYFDALAYSHEGSDYDSSGGTKNKTNKYKRKKMHKKTVKKKKNTNRKNKTVKKKKNKIHKKTLKKKKNTNRRNKTLK
jgi:hypothetical protein